jgi:acyl-CoA synthetase (AMP-forming)/AMP-acid ligase II
MMSGRIKLWRGYHSPKLLGYVGDAWDSEELLVLCPPGLRDFRFISALASDEIEFVGDWPEDLKIEVRSLPKASGTSLARLPVLGVFTSGTLSPTPRLALYSKHGVEASVRSIYGLFSAHEIKHLFCYPQAFHTFGLTLGYVAAHIFGWKLHTPEGKYSSQSHLQRLSLKEYELLTLGTPTHFYDLMQAVKHLKRPIEPSYSCIVGGASVSRGMWERIQKDLKILAPSIGYGCTEASPGITHLPPGLRPSVDDAVGFPLPSIRAERLSEGLEISGTSLCIGLIEDGRLSSPKSVIIRDQIAACGDGGWVFNGRLDLSLNRGGTKYSLELVEKVLAERAGIHAVASAVSDPRLGEDLGLAILGPVDMDRFQTAQSLLKRDFALQLQIKNTRFLDAFPLNECSKLDRRAISSMFSDGDSDSDKAKLVPQHEMSL